MSLLNIINRDYRRVTVSSEFQRAGIALCKFGRLIFELLVPCGRISVHEALNIDGNALHWHGVSAGVIRALACARNLECCQWLRLPEPATQAKLNNDETVRDAREECGLKDVSNSM